jgi:hypothetical protein
MEMKRFEDLEVKEVVQIALGYGGQWCGSFAQLDSEDLLVIVHAAVMTGRSEGYSVEEIPHMTLSEIFGEFSQIPYQEED